jgi:hypothetical protein
MNLSLIDGYCASVKVFLQEFMAATQKFNEGEYLSLPVQKDNNGHTCKSFSFSINKTAVGNLSVE